MFHDPSGDPITAVLDALLDQREARPPQRGSPDLPPDRPPQIPLVARLLAALGPRWARLFHQEKRLH